MPDLRGETPHHITPIKIYFRVWASLIVLTAITVFASYIDLDQLNILIAMAIASIKAILVILFFMGLKYEGQENTVTFMGAVVFLVIFVSLTAADLFYREDVEPMRVEGAPAQPLATSGDVARLAAASPELIAKGKATFQQQCASCHGPEGRGDGPAAQSLNPKPRNFTQTEGWKKGRDIQQIFTTINEGLPGTPMPPFGTLSIEDKFALTHFVRSITPNPPPADPKRIAALSEQLKGAAKPRLKIDRAIEKLVEEWKASHPR